jgi:hypothetical protein
MRRFLPALMAFGLTLGLALLSELLRELGLVLALPQFGLLIFEIFRNLPPIAIRGPLVMNGSTTVGGISNMAGYRVSGNSTGCKPLSHPSLPQDLLRFRFVPRHPASSSPIREDWQHYPGIQMPFAAITSPSAGNCSGSGDFV